MDTRTVGSLHVTEVGLGCNNFGMRIDEARTSEVVVASLDAGITFFDTADVYGGGLSEEYLGRALGERRSEAVIATKFGGRFEGAPAGSGGSARWIEAAAEASLRRLGTDYIDLYQFHQPDDGVPIEETLGALNALVKSGKVREIGCSNFSVAQIEASTKAGGDGGAATFVSVQNQYSLLHREPEGGVLEACERHSMGFLPYFPLHSGMLTGKYAAGRPPPEGTRLAAFPEESAARFLGDESFTAVQRLQGFCAEHERSLLELAFSWLLARGSVVSVIAGATSPDQVRANAAAASWSLTEEDLAAVDAALEITA